MSEKTQSASDSMSEKTQSASGGIGFTGLLTILLIGLKLGHVINWSWWWVLSPLWLSFTAVIAILFIMLIVAIFVAILKEKP